MAQTITLQTGAWYGDQSIELAVPEFWDLAIHRPRWVAPLSDQEILEKLEAPNARSSLRKLCRGKSTPLVIVDDLCRPTPATKVLPHLLNIFQQENIPLSNVTVLMATGTHGSPPADALRKKAGDMVVSNCKTLVHDCFRGVRKIGTTSSGTPVHVNEAVLNSDLVIGVGGIYPNHTAGFGGGSKIVLGILGMRSIFHLHRTHDGAGWGEDGMNGSFRKDLDEIAGMVKMQLSIALQVNERREVIRVYCGDSREYLAEAVRFHNEIFTAPKPHEADVVIANTYPNDLSLTFARIKGFVPFGYCRKTASRIAVAACHEGVGLHNIYPYVNIPKFFKMRHVARLLSVLTFAQFVEIAAKRVGRLKPAAGTLGKPGSAGGTVGPKNSIWLYRPGQPSSHIPDGIPGLQVKSVWDEVLAAVEREQGKGRRLNVAVYPCAFLQNLR